MNDEELLSIVKRLNKGGSTEEIAKEFYISCSALIKRLSKGGYIYNKKLGVWYHKKNKKLSEHIKNLVTNDYLEEIEDLYSKRYFCEEVYDEPTTEITLNIRDNLIQEIQAKAEKIGLDIEWIIELVLLKFLNENYPRKSLNKYCKLIELFDPEVTPFFEIEQNIKRYEEDPKYREEIDEEIKECDEERFELFGEEFGGTIKDILEREYEYKKKWHERDRHKE